MNLGNQPVEVFVEDVYLLVVPSPQNNDDPEEDERRAQAAKAERVQNAELLHMRGQAETAQGTPRVITLLRIITTMLTHGFGNRRSSAVTRADRFLNCQDCEQFANYRQEYPRPI
jgi:hypothetical protein